MKGGPPASQLSGDITPQFQLDDANYLENRMVASWRSYGAFVSAAANAGLSSAVFLRNPSSSGIVAVIEKIFLATGGAASNPQLTRGTPGPGNQTAGVGAGSRDLRQTAVSASLIGSSVNAGGVNGFIFWAGAPAMPANSQQDVIVTENQEIVLMPGDIVAGWGNLANQGISVSFFWRERALEEGELLTGG